MSTQNSLLNLDFDSRTGQRRFAPAVGMGNFDRDGETGEVIEVVSVADRLDFFVGDRLGGGFANGGIPGMIGFRGDRTREVPPELEALQASIEALHESEEFAAVMAELEELRDGISQLRDMVELPADFPNIRGLRVNISELLESEESLVLDELRVSVEELIASGELTDGTELLASIEALDASIEALRASEEFSQVQATIEELRASGDLPENFPDEGFPGRIIGIGGDRFRGDRTREVPPELEALQASIEALHESEEFAAVMAELEELRDTISQLRDMVELPADFPNIRGLRVNISELLESEDSLDGVLDRLRVSVEELIASGELTDGAELLASIEELDASVEALRASEEFAQVQATIAELRASGDLPENFPDGGFPGGIIRIGGDRFRGDRTREGFPDFITGELPEGIEFSDDLLNGGIGEIRSIRGDRFGGGIIGELPGDGEGLADPEQLRDRIEELIASGDFEGIRGGIGRGQGRDRIFSRGLAVGLRGDRVPEGLLDVDLPGLFPDRVVDEGSVV